MAHKYGIYRLSIFLSVALTAFFIVGCIDSPTVSHSDNADSWLAIYQSEFADGEDIPYFASLSPDGGIYIGGTAGFSEAENVAEEFILLKYSNIGVLTWLTEPDLTDDCRLSPDAMWVDGFSDVYVAGTLACPEDTSEESGRTFGLVKVDKTGQRLWFYQSEYRSLGPVSFNNDKEGRVYVQAQGENACGLFAFDDEGQPLWQSEFSGPTADVVESELNCKQLELTNFGFARVVGDMHVVYEEEATSNLLETDSVFVANFDYEGGLVWTAYLGLVFEDPVLPFDAEQPDDRSFLLSDAKLDREKNLILSGQVIDDQGQTDAFAASIDSDGNWLWTRTYGGDALMDDAAGPVEADEHGNVIVLACTTGESGTADITVSKFDADGQELWSLPVEDVEPIQQYPTDLGLDSDGGVYIAGVACTAYLSEGSSFEGCTRYLENWRSEESAGCADGPERLLTVKFNALGEQLWTRELDVSSGYDRAILDVDDDDPDQYVLTFSDDSEDSEDILVYRYDTGSSNAGGSDGDPLACGCDGLGC